MGLKNICTRTFKHHYGGSIISYIFWKNSWIYVMSICTSLDLYFEMGPPMSENQVKES